MPNLSLIPVCECRMGDQGVPVWHQWRNMIADMTSFFVFFEDVYPLCLTCFITQYLCIPHRGLSQSLSLFDSLSSSSIIIDIILSIALSPPFYIRHTSATHTYTYTQMPALCLWLFGNLPPSQDVATNGLKVLGKKQQSFKD